MDHWKKNSSLRYFAGLALLMIPVVLMIITAPAFARFRSEQTGDIMFNVREPGQICFVNIENNQLEVIDNENNKFVWTESEGTKSLEISVANGSGNSDYSEYEQNVTVRLFAGLGLLVEEGETGITLEHEGNIYTAKAEKIVPGSEFYNLNGDGWIITFFDKSEKEFSSVLRGGRLDHFDVKITVENSSVSENTQIIPIAKIID